MKRNDKMVLIVVVIVSAVFSLILSKILISPPKNRETKVEVMDKITSDFNNTPDKQYFNSSAVDPTTTITIGESNSPTPFNAPKKQ